MALRRRPSCPEPQRRFVIQTKRGEIELKLQASRMGKSSHGPFEPVRHCRADPAAWTDRSAPRQRVTMWPSKSMLVARSSHDSSALAWVVEWPSPNPTAGFASYNSMALSCAPNNGSQSLIMASRASTGRLRRASLSFSCLSEQLQSRLIAILLLIYCALHTDWPRG